MSFAGGFRDCLYCMTCPQSVVAPAGVTGGVESFPDFQQKFFPEVAAAQAADNGVDPYCSYSSQKLSAFTSVLFLSGGSMPINAFGRCYDVCLVLPSCPLLAFIASPNSCTLQELSSVFSPGPSLPLVAGSWS